MQPLASGPPLQPDTAPRGLASSGRANRHRRCPVARGMWEETMTHSSMMTAVMGSLALVAFVTSSALVYHRFGDLAALVLH